MLENLAGQTLGRFQLLRHVREDGGEALFFARDTRMQRDVGLKVIRPAFAREPGFEEQFHDAARTAQRLDHLSLVQVLDYGEARGYPWISMEWIPGDHLGELLRSLKRRGQWLFLEEGVQIVRHLALAMAYVRSQGAPQRHLAPHHIKIKPAQGERLPYLPVLVDLDLDDIFPQVETDRQGAIAPYLSPEATLGQGTDSRSDVYSLGVLLYELTAGQLPFPIQNMEDAARYHTRQPLPPPRTIRPDLPGELEQVIVTSLAKNPAQRYATPADLANALDEVLPVVSSIRSAPPVLESATSLAGVYRQSVEAERRATPPAPPPPAPEPETAPVQAATTQASTVRPTQAIPPRPAEILFETPNLSIEPGGSLTTTLTIINKSNTAERFRLGIEGLAPGWFTLTHQSINLQPGEAKDINLAIHPPRNPQVKAGRYPITARVIPQTSPNLAVDERAILTVGVLSDFRVELYTRRLQAGEVGQVAVQNLENTAENFTVTFHDPAGELAFDPEQAPLRLAASQTGVVDFRADTRRPRWFGSPATHPFSVHAYGPGGKNQGDAGELLSRPVIPGWVLGAFLVIILCFAGALAVFLGSQGVQSSRATSTALALNTAAVAAIQATQDAATATALFISNANEATVQAVTATAGWLDADTDSDGLVNRREVELGTVPTEPDTDRDGLSDGDEVQRRTDPLRPDTDEDGLQDGLEVQRNLDPLKADTDGDGLPDGQDAAPLQTSTPAPNLPATQAAAATLTAAVAQQAAAQTATAQAIQQATAAAGQAAARTATAAAAAATAQAGAAQTATAWAIQTATAAAVVTPAPPPGERLAYIYSTRRGVAENYQSLLDAAGYTVDLLSQDAILSTDFSPYQLILIGPETGAEATWGDAEGRQVNRIFTTGLPIIGLGDGGYSFFGRFGLAIGYPNGSAGQRADVFVVDPASTIWSDPYEVAIPDTSILPVYERESTFIAVNVPVTFPELTLIGRSPDSPERYLILSQSGKYLLWGFNAGPNEMVQDGLEAFANLVNFLLP